MAAALSHHIERNPADFRTVGNLALRFLNDYPLSTFNVHRNQTPC